MCKRRLNVALKTKKEKENNICYKVVSQHERDSHGKVIYKSAMINAYHIHLFQLAKKNPNCLRKEVAALSITYELEKWKFAEPSTFGLFVFKTKEQASVWMNATTKTMPSYALLKCQYRYNIVETPFIMRWDFVEEFRRSDIITLRKRFSKGGEWLYKLYELTGLTMLAPRGTYLVRALKPLKRVDFVTNAW
jgi:hypothetical protein